MNIPVKIKTKFVILLLPILIFTACRPIQNPEITGSKDVYDAQLAAKLGADEYGMRSYVLAVLKTGSADITEKDKRAELFAGHFTNIKRLTDEGKLVLAGPLDDDNGELRGIFILNVATLKEAQELVATDPAINAGIFIVELTRFYGTAGLMQLNDLNNRIQKTEIG